MGHVLGQQQTAEAEYARMCAERDTLSVMMENSPEAALAYLDPELRFVQVNTAYAEGCGYAKDELIGRCHFDLFPNPENEAIFRRVLATGEPEAFRQKAFVFAHQPQRGVTYWDWSITPVKSEEGVATGLVLSLVDVTERVRRQKLSDALTRLDGLIHSTLDFEQVMRRLIGGAVRASGCESGSIAFREGDVWHATYAHDLPADFPPGRALSPEEMPVAEKALRTREPVVINDVSADEEMRDALEPFGIKSILDVPLFVGDRVVGVLALVYYSAPIAFSPDVVHFAQRLAASTSLAVTNARLYEEEHRVAEAMRHALARPVPHVPDLEIGLVYRPAYQVERVGGDFYDVFETDDGRIAVLVGDVSGKGLPAAGLTETVRSSVRTLAYLGLSSAEVLTKLNDTLKRQLEEATFVTAVLALVDPARRTALVASAGHPPPVLCAASPAIAEVPTGVVLGAFDAAYAETEVDFDEATLLFYTDGVTEVRRGRLLYGQDRLLRSLEGCDPAEPQALVEHVLDEITRFGRGKLPDDVAMVAVRRAARRGR